MKKSKSCRENLGAELGQRWHLLRSKASRTLRKEAESGGWSHSRETRDRDTEQQAVMRAER